jgi:hypothetical protein
MMSHKKVLVDRVLVPSPSIPWRVLPAACPRSVATGTKTLLFIMNR